MRRGASLALAALVALATAACSADSTLTVRNDSSFTIVEINLSPEGESTWGADLLGGDVLAPGDALEVSAIECDVYDLRVVDELDSECIVLGVDLCFDDAVWALDDADFAACDLGL